MEDWEEIRAQIQRDFSNDYGQWVKWKAVIDDKTCPQALKLNECYFIFGKMPMWPEHPRCRCTLEKIMNPIPNVTASAMSAIEKFTAYIWGAKYLNDPENYHGKDKIFEDMGYTVADARFLQQMFCEQAIGNYCNGDYTLGSLGVYGQHISIVIDIPNDHGGTTKIISGWMVEPNGLIRLATPFGGYHERRKK